jgi:hypothetical protein
MKQEMPSLDKASVDPPVNPYRWIMLSMVWLLYMFFGISYRFLSPLITRILADLNMSYSEMGLILGSWQLTYIGAASGAGFFI